MYCHSNYTYGYRLSHRKAQRRAGWDHFKWTVGARDDDPGGGAAAAAGSVKIGFWEKRSVMIGIRT